ncbi:MAG TPA: DUF2269 domain-containing protein [Thermoanaerobaculia bacterium]
MITPAVRKALLTTHVVAAVGWIGAVVAFLGLAVVGLTSADEPTVRGAYLVMEPAARLVLLPLAIASLATGVIQSLITSWGLIRHYWVVFKLAINVFALILLMTYMNTFRAMAAIAADPRAELAAVRNSSPLLHAVLALLILLVATVLAIFKPKGLTPYGWGREQALREPRKP